MKTGILLSGGIDSIALAFWKKPDWAITINYGQKPAQAEIRAASKVCAELNVKHEILQIDCSCLGSGDLAGSPAIDNAPSSEWWPFRNQMLATFAGIKALPMGVEELMFGAVASDNFHADGTEQFFNHLNITMSIQEGLIKVSAPAIKLTSVELVKKSGIDLSLLGWAHSCHIGNSACGNCRGCYKHQTVMDTLGHGYY